MDVYLCVSGPGEDEGGAALGDSVRDDSVMKPAETDTGGSEEHHTNQQNFTQFAFCQRLINTQI